MSRLSNNRLYRWVIFLIPLVFILILAIPRPASTQAIQSRTPIPGGTISEDTTWTAANSPYDVLGSITVADGATLTIEPGVELYWNSAGHRLTINSGAVLAAAGTAVDPITFTSDTTSAGSWRGLYINSGGQATLAHCEIGYAGSGFNEAMYIASTAVTMTDCHIHHSNYRGIQINGVDLSPELTRVQVENSANHAIYQNTINMTPVYSDLTLSGHSNDAIAINGGTTDRHLTLVPPGSAGEATIPYRIVGSSGVTVGASQALTLTPGAAIHFTFSNRTLAVNNGAALYAVGTADQPVIFGDSEGDPGSWHGIVVNAGGQATLAHCQINSGGGAALSGRALLLASSDVTVTDCVIQNSSRDGVNINGAGLSPSLTRVQVENNDLRAVYQNTADMTPTYNDLSVSGNGQDAIVINGGASGNINRHITLTPPGSIGEVVIPYHFVGGMTIAASQALTLTPGVEVQMTGGIHYRMTVNSGGRLHAVGTAENPVVFNGSSPTPGSWSGIYINGGGQATLSHCQINYAGHRGAAATTSGAIRTASSDVSVTHCLIQQSAHEAITANEAQPYLHCNQITDNAFGLRNETPTAEVDARLNWWGSDSGPFHPTLNPDGEGDSVSNGVLFNPWRLCTDDDSSFSLYLPVIVR